MNAPANPEYVLTTEEFAAMNLVKAQTVRSRLCRFGSYFGVRPAKLANGRTAWPSILVRCDIDLDETSSNTTK